MKSLVPALSFAALAVLSIARPSFAQETPSREAISLDSVVVVGSRTPEAISEIPASVYVISGDDIQSKARAGVPFKELLGQLIPSLDVGAQNRTNFGQNLRGRAVQVLIDGVSITGSRAISRQFDAIDPFNIARIEVLSGSSSLYGGGATGGIINIVTRRGEPGFHGELQGGARTDGHGKDGQAAAAISGGDDRVVGRLAAAWQKEGAAYDADGKPILVDITQTDLQHNETRDVSGTVDVDLRDLGRLRLLGQHYTSEMTGDVAAYLGPNLVGALGTRPDLLSNRSGFSSDVAPSTRRDLWTADWSAPRLLFGQDVLLQTFWRDEKLDFYPFPGSASVTAGTVRRTASYYGTSRQNTETYGLKSALIARFGPASLTYGVDYTHERFAATQSLFNPTVAYASGGLTFNTIGSLDRYPGFETRQLAGYAQADWKVLDTVNLNGGVRYQKTGVAVDSFVGFPQQVLVFNNVAGAADAIPGGRNDYSAALPNAGAVWTFAPKTQLYANYSEGFDLPDPAKYYGQGNYTLAAVGGRLVLRNGTSVESSSLSAVKTRQVEFGVRGDGDVFQYRAATFYAVSDKAIVTVPVTLAIDVVDQKVRTYGVEGHVAYAPVAHWRVGANGLWVRTEQRVADAWQKQTVTTASPPKLAAFVGYANALTSVALQSTTVAHLGDATGHKLAGYTTLDLSGSQKLGRVLLTAGIQNLLDRNYQTLWSQRAQILYNGLVTPQTLDYPGRGRSFTLTANVDF